MTKPIEMQQLISEAINILTQCGIPFTSYDSAKEFAFKRIDEKLQTLLETNKPLRYYKDDLIKLADNHGYIATQQVLDCINAEELKQRQEQIAKLESQLVVLKQ